MREEQPTELVEVENAAYVWVKHCRGDLLDELNKKEDLTDNKSWENVLWCHERLSRAIARYERAHKERMDAES